MTTTFLKVKDNAEGTLSADIVAATNPIVLNSGEGALFPATGNYVITIDNEKMLCTARVGDSLTVTRAYDGTTASDHLKNTKVQLRVVAEHIDDITVAIIAVEGEVDTIQSSTAGGGDHTHASTGRQGGKLDWDDVWSDAAHDHTSAAEGGSLSVASLVSGEIPGGDVNGVNTAYTTASAYSSGSLRVFKNGIRLKGGGEDYTEGASAFTMVTAPATGTILLVDYATVPSVFATGSTSFIYSELCGGTPNGVLVDFTTASSYVSLSTVVFLDGVRMRRAVDYTESADKTITFATAPTTGSEILIDYQSAVSTAGNADTLDGKHLQDIYPVGTIYTNKTNSANPSTYFGFGTWVAVAGFVVAGFKSGDANFGTAGAEVGVAEVTLTSAQSGLPAHSHQINGADGANGAWTVTSMAAKATNYNWNSGSVSAANAASAHTNIQPTLVAYVWERTA